MYKHKYIAARVDRRTYLKGAFRGKFVGRLDLSKSDPKRERFYDLEILEGEIETRQDHLVPWMEGKEPHEFSTETVSPTHLPGKIGVVLHCLNGEVKYFKIALKEIKLMDCHLSDQVYAKNEVHGTITGLISGYVLHPDMAVKEIAEEEPGKQKPAPDQGKKESRKKELVNRPYIREASPVTEPSSGVTRFLQVLAMFIGLGLFIGVLLIAKSWITALLGVLGTGLLIRLLQRWTGKRYGSGISGTITALAALLAFIGFAFYLAGHYEELTNPKTGKVTQAAVAGMTSIKEKAAGLFAQSNYQDALELYNQLLETEANNPVLHYQRALCYNKLGRIGEAVADLRSLISNGDTEAIALNNRINPIKVRQIGTQIRCNDGTISHSRNRRGTCSHHGGVKKWDEPVYQEYREYE